MAGQPFITRGSLEQMQMFQMHPWSIRGLIEQSCCDITVLATAAPMSSVSISAKYSFQDQLIPPATSRGSMEIKGIFCSSFLVSQPVAALWLPPRQCSLSLQKRLLKQRGRQIRNIDKSRVRNHFLRNNINITLEIVGVVNVLKYCDCIIENVP